MTELIFNVPWWLPAVIAAIGIGVFISGNNRQLRGPRNGGIGIIAFAVIWGGTSYFVSTPTEKALDGTTAIIKSVEKRDWVTFRKHLDPDTEFAIYKGADELTKGAELAAEKFNIRDVTITSREVNPTESLITVTVTVFTQQDPYPLRTTWEFDWQNRGGEWLLYEIRPIRIGEQNLDPDSVVNQNLPRVPKP